MAPDQSSNLAEELARLREDYLQRLPAELNALQTLAASLRGDESDHATLDELHYRLHRLAGLPGVFNLVALSAHARTLENQVKAWLDDTRNKPDASSRQSLVTDIAALVTLTANTGSGGKTS